MSKPLTVSALIAQLEKMPADSEVWFYANGHDYVVGNVLEDDFCGGEVARVVLEENAS